MLGGDSQADYEISPHALLLLSAHRASPVPLAARRPRQTPQTRIDAVHTQSGGRTHIATGQSARQGNDERSDATIAEGLVPRPRDQVQPPEWNRFSRRLRQPEPFRGLVQALERGVDLGQLP